MLKPAPVWSGSLPEPAYGTPQALRQAIADRLRQFAGSHPGTQLADLQRQFAYDRLLSRVFHTEPQRWVLKGATAMLARFESVARHTLDVDLYSEQGDLAGAESALRRAAAHDLGDHFRFTIDPGRAVTAAQQALRLPVVAFLGVTRFASFHIDLVTGLSMTGIPDEVPPLVPGDLPGLVRSSYRAYPVADHIADKVCALLERHARPGGAAVESTRYRDLADLAVFAHTVSPAAVDLRRALGSEAARRGLRLPDTLPLPAGPDWPGGYARVARDVPGLAERDLGAALALVRRLIAPVLSGTAAGQWDAERLAWE